MEELLKVFCTHRRKTGNQKKINLRWKQLIIREDYDINNNINFFRRR